LTGGSFVLVVDKEDLLVPDFVLLEQGLESATECFGRFPFALRDSGGSALSSCPRSRISAACVVDMRLDTSVLTVRRTGNPEAEAGCSTGNNPLTSPS
jgi:hypothetical protein